MALFTPKIRGAIVVLSWTSLLALPNYFLFRICRQLHIIYFICEARVRLMLCLFAPRQPVRLGNHIFESYCFLPVFFVIDVSDSIIWIRNVLHDNVVFSVDFSKVQFSRGVVERVLLCNRIRRYIHVIFSPANRQMPFLIDVVKHRQHIHIFSSVSFCQLRVFI